MILGLIIAIILGGGVSFAAENTLPGDTLYPVKTHINENVKSMFEFSDDAQARWDARIAERRLEEAEKLQSEGRLTAEVRANIKADIKDHLQQAQDEIAKVKDNDAKAGAELDTFVGVKLGAHGNTLLDLENDTSASANANSNGNANGNVNASTSVNSQASLNPNTEQGANGRLTAALNKIDEVKKFIELKTILISADAKVKVDAKLAEATTAITSGKAKLEAKLYAEASDLFDKAHDLAQEAKLLVGGSIDVQTQ